MEAELFIDSGAPSLYNSLVRKFKVGNRVNTGSKLADRKHDDFSFLTTERYLEYRQAYCDFLLKNQKYFHIMINLDIINNSEETWKNQLWFEERGLKVTPVFHYGEDTKWLEMYLKKGYKRIALGGLHPTPYRELKEPLDELWIKYFLDNRGYPKIKVHGFAVSGPKLLHRYPFATCDSTSWVKLGLFGCVTIPKMKYGKYDYKEFPMVIFVSVRSSNTYRRNSKHIDNMPEHEKQTMLEYIHSKGFELGESKLKKETLNYELKSNERLFKRKKSYKIVEVIEKVGIRNDGVQRDTFNASYYQDLAASIPPYPWKAKFFKQRSLFG